MFLSFRLERRYLESSELSHLAQHAVSKVIFIILSIETWKLLNSKQVATHCLEKERKLIFPE